MDFDYNTQRAKMALPEYGRNVQKMVDHAKTIKDRQERNRAAQTIIQVMGNLNPHLRDQGDFKHKLWDHLAIMSDFELDIDSPYPTPEPSTLKEKPARVPYMQGTIKYPHYGRIAQSMIIELMAMEDGSEKDLMIVMVLNHMKRSSVTWNKSAVSDEVIINDFRDLSFNKIEVPPGIKLIGTKDLLQPTVKKRPQQQTAARQQHQQQLKKKRQQTKQPQKKRTQGNN